MDRETITVNTPVDNHIVILKSYLTGKEKREIKNSELPRSINYSVEEGVQGIDPVAFANNSEDMTLRTIIVSIDGKTDIDIVETVLAMKSVDSDFIVSEINNIVKGLSTEKKTQ